MKIVWEKKTKPFIELGNIQIGDTFTLNGSTEVYMRIQQETSIVGGGGFWNAVSLDRGVLCSLDDRTKVFLRDAELIVEHQ